MKQKHNRGRNDGRSGMAMIVVMGLALLGLIATLSAAFSVSSRTQQTRKQVAMEQAFYIAEGGAERGAAYLGLGNNTTVTLTGNLGNGTYRTIVNCDLTASGKLYVDIVSTGTVYGVSRGVTMRGVHRVSWARYALWYNREQLELWMMPGEKFYGLFYSKPKLRFSDNNLKAAGQTQFFDRAWTGAASYDVKTTAVKPIFDKGIVYNHQARAEENMLAEINFVTELKANARSDLVLRGETTVVIDNATMKITNSDKGWNNKVVNFADDTLLYVETYSKKVGYKTTTYPGNLTVGGPNGLDGRLTMVAEGDIIINNHIRYKKNPRTDTTSTDALGLVAKNHVRIGTTAPKNLEVYAHIICQSGGFGVDSYDNRNLGARGTLLIYGGIVNDTRNAVGTSTTYGQVSGYSKDYRFDDRFTEHPPPFYPEVSDMVEWDTWEG